MNGTIVSGNSTGLLQCDKRCPKVKLLSAGVSITGNITRSGKDVVVSSCDFGFGDNTGIVVVRSE